MRNVEIKARFDDFSRARLVLSARAARPVGSFTQTDTFLATEEPGLRDKLREVAGLEAERIRYRRTNTTAPRPSDYTVETLPPEGVRDLLAASRRIGVVRKVRELWLWENVRIHLDDVAALGRFVELEAVVGEVAEEICRDRVDDLLIALGISEADLVAVAYLDLLAGATDRLTPRAGA